MLAPTPTVPLRSIQEGGKARTVQLIADLAEAWGLTGGDFSKEVGDPGQELEFELVNFELFVIELGVGRHGWVRRRIEEDENEDDLMSRTHPSLLNSSTSLFATSRLVTPSDSAVNVVITRCRNTGSATAVMSSCRTM